MPDQNSAEDLAQYLVAKKLAACVNILAPCVSIYHWQGKTERTSEFPLLIKTTKSCYSTLQDAICERHPYELPEIVHVTINGGLPAYLAWLARETST